MDRHDQIIVRRQDQVLQLTNAVPLARTNKDGSVWICLADFSDGLGVNRIDYARLRCVLCFIEQFKAEGAGKGGVVASNLAPEREKLLGLPRRIAGELIEMVDIEQNRQPVGQCVSEFGT